ncbi:glycosyltransferase family 2 protein [Leptothermofonsia sichuanensis E412]|uniref:glycosyltransferase family 2 protein n=1 Tax=Leptothermofonsia sichuanensis TaxID=2917832 RepID=UPI001CA77441|nr:glycosyltransferase family 2 protein [Leptothermofonsia sichuanensis]QZZ22099.1 glycosyltransferase family 2 protein [Leptothermofonsia sichuanensis E412]
MLSIPAVPALIDVSIVVPLYNEAPNIDHLLKRLESVCDALELSYEIVCINDGSRDETLSCLIEHHRRNSSIKVINLSRNFGKEVALTAGLDYTTGQTVVPIDADLQDPPELIADMLEKWRQGYDVVYAVRRSRQGESWLKKFTADTFYRIISRMSRVSIPRNTGDFRLMDRKVVDALKQLPERSRFMKGLFAWVGFKQTAIYYDRAPRYKGQTKWNYWKLWNFAIDGITSFSLVPLKVWSYVGLSLSILALIYASFLILRTLIYGVDLPGYASLMVTVLFLGGIQLITLGVIGEYLGRVYEEVKGRPLYLVRDVYGFDSPLPSTSDESQLHSDSGTKLQPPGKTENGVLL